MHTAVENERRLLDRGEVAERLQVSRATIYRLIGNGQLPAFQLGGPGSTFRISERELEAWLRGEA